VEEVRSDLLRGHLGGWAAGGEVEAHTLLILLSVGLMDFGFRFWLFCRK
jgi:hypothetical protein